MKKIFLTLLTITGVAVADYSITTDDSYYNNPTAWVYVWTGKESQQWENGNNWQYYESAGDDSAGVNAENKPINADPAFIGYDFAMVDGKQVLTANDSNITVMVPKWMGGGGRIFLGNNVTLFGTSNGYSSNQSMTYNFGDFSGTSVISMGDFWMQANARVNFTGTINMTSPTFSYTLFTSTNMKQNSGIWDASGIDVFDKHGNKLTYTTDEEKFGMVGYYWLEQNTTENGVFTVSVNAVPEPAVLSFSALALAGLAARRRRK